MTPEVKFDDMLDETVESLISEVFARCVEDAPNYGVKLECFRASIIKTIRKYLDSTKESNSEIDVHDFISQLHANDLFLALACANGNERSWWEFDQTHRSYLERVARHLAKTDIDAQEVVDQVYIDLYGQKIVDGERLSKFASYSGRGTLRGWLRTVVWHSLVDMHRASHNEVSLDELNENIGEGAAHSRFVVSETGGENTMLDQIETSRYRNATTSAIASAFASLDDHEKLLLLYYHVENMKLREIAHLVEDETSVLRGWFQRQSSKRNGSSRTHESTVMRWLEKSYSKVLKKFTELLKEENCFSDNDIAICMKLATNDLSSNSIFGHLVLNKKAE